jgi:hypothetical protein
MVFILWIVVNIVLQARLNATAFAARSGLPLPRIGIDRPALPRRRVRQTCALLPNGPDEQGGQDALQDHGTGGAAL